MSQVPTELAADLRVRNLLGATLNALLLAADKRHVAHASIVAACQQANTRRELVVALKKTGLSHADIADAAHITRQRVNQIAQRETRERLPRARSRYTLPALDELRSVALALLQVDPTLYAKDGNVLLRRVAAKLRVMHPDWGPVIELRQALTKLRLNIVEVAFTHHGIAPHERVAWIEQQQRAGRTQKEMVDLLNRGLIHPISYMAFSRYVRRYPSVRFDMGRPRRIVHIELLLEPSIRILA